MKRESTPILLFLTIAVLLMAINPLVFAGPAPTKDINKMLGLRIGRFVAFR